MTTLPPLPPFLDRATAPPACRAEPDLWFSPDPDDTALAKRVCSRCPLLGPCRAYGLAAAESGVWGGLSAWDREVARGRVPPRPAGVCARSGVASSESTYRSHWARHEVPCGPCRAAHDWHVAVGRRRRLVEIHEEGGSVHGVVLHGALGEEACGLCRSARREQGAAEGPGGGCGGPGGGRAAGSSSGGVIGAQGAVRGVSACPAA